MKVASTGRAAAFCAALCACGPTMTVPLSGRVVACGPAPSYCGGGEECVQGECVPACASAVRCGDDLLECCAANELCQGGLCEVVDTPCFDDLDCGGGEVCDPAMRRCVGPVGDDCIATPTATPLALQLEWSDEVDEIGTFPAIADVDDDGKPELLINTFNATDPNGATGAMRGELVVREGATFEERFRLRGDNLDGVAPYSRSSLGTADFDGDGSPDIVYPGRPLVGIDPFPNNASLIHSVNGFGDPLWSSHSPDGLPYFVYVRSGGATVVNLDADPQTEIVYGTAILDHDGTVVFDQPHESGLGGGAFGSPRDSNGGLSVVADLTGDGYPEIVAGRSAWEVDWRVTTNGTPVVSLRPLWQYAGPDGFAAVGDLDGDGNAEVVLAATDTLVGHIAVLDGASGALWCAGAGACSQAVGIVGGGIAGPPALADFDGDGRLEIATAGADAVSVFDLHRAGESEVSGVPFGGLFVRWSAPIEDDESGGTGVSAFDFEGDGAAELLLNDACHARIYRGTDGTVAWSTPSSAVTIHAYPVPADVDGDGETELVVVSADGEAMSRCERYDDYRPRRGVFVYGSAGAPWARTRRTWNAHSYAVTHASGAGLVPRTYLAPWDKEGAAGFRAGPAMPRVEPRLAVDLSAGFGDCDEGRLQMQITVRNTGSVSAPAGIHVAVYEGAPGPDNLVATAITTASIDPGSSRALTREVESSAGSTSFTARIEAEDPAAPCAPEATASLGLVSCAGVAGPR